MPKWTLQIRDPETGRLRYVRDRTTKAKTIYPSGRQALDRAYQIGGKKVMATARRID